MSEYGLTMEEKITIVINRIKQFEAEKFQHELNLTTAVAINNNEAVQAANAAIGQIDTAITVHKQQLAELEN
jgi:hypothetical protein